MQGYSKSSKKLFGIKFDNSSLPEELVGYQDVRVIYALMLYNVTYGFDLTDDGRLACNLTVMAYPVIRTITLTELTSEMDKMAWRLARVEEELENMKNPPKVTQTGLAESTMNRLFFPIEDLHKNLKAKC